MTTPKKERAKLGANSVNPLESRGAELSEGTAQESDCWDIFLAHPSADLSIAEHLFDLLKPLRVFLDTRSLQPGDDWDQEVSSAQSKALMTVVLVSSRTDKAYYQREEIAAAIALAREDKTKHRVIPIFLQDEHYAKTKPPYGLGLKNGIKVSDIGELPIVASKLKQLVKRLNQETVKTGSYDERSSQRSLRIESALVEALSRLADDDLMDEVIIPLVAELHPGKIESAVLSRKGVGNIVSVGSHRLGRAHTLFINVRSIHDSLDSVSFRELTNDCKSIRSSGATCQSGQICFPNEVWSIGNLPAIEPRSTDIDRTLERLSRENIVFVPYEEVCKLLIDHLPETASRLSKYSTPEIIRLISTLSKHNEGRAFGFSLDRNIADFYVTAAISPSTVKAYAAIKGETVIEDYAFSPVIPIRQVLKENELKLDDEALRKRVEERVIDRESKGIIKKYDIKVLLKMPSSSALREEYSKDRNLHAKSVKLTFKFKAKFEDLLKHTKSSLERCPSTLGSDVSLVKQATEQLELTESFLRDVSDGFGEKMPATKSRGRAHYEAPYKIPPRVTVPNPENLLGLDRVVLIEGPPGCGKTTLMRMLVVDLLSKNRQVRYVAAFNITPKDSRSSLKDIVQTYSQGSIGRSKDLKSAVLIIDGLDEAPFDLSGRILSSYLSFARVVVSARSTFSTSVRSEFFHIALSPFSKAERDQFFENWFKNDPLLIAQARDLISKYRDIDTHTRLPLIATIVVALLQNGIAPRTRSEIYAFRLDLLLSRWDRLRGVKRLLIDNPDAKRRFLRELAYHMHANYERRRNIDVGELRDVYERSLGSWGYRVSYEKILKDLVVGSGVLAEESPGVYSFGHLTFQEHLAGEHICKNYSIEQIAHLLGSDWWREALNFYASIKGDITELIDHMMSGLAYLAHVRQLAEMTHYAPYTSTGAVQSLQDILKDSSDSNWIDD